MNNAVAIKNTILILLILLIAHFLIKNFVKGNTLLVKSENIQYPFKNENLQYSFNIKNPVSEITSHKIEPSLNDQNKNELLQYVLDDTNDSLNKYYSENTVSGDVKDLESEMQSQYNECKVKDDQHLPLNTTCDGSIDFTDFTKRDKKKIIEDNISGQVKWGTLLNKYENENQMNSETLLNTDIQAFNNNYDEWDTINK